MATYTHAYIYLIREREFLLRNEPVFKIGRGAQEADRVIKRLATGYKKGSEIWLTIRCPMADYKEVEYALKSIFRERFTKHGDGSEYFVGDPTEMTKLITEVVHKSWSEAVATSQQYIVPVQREQFESSGDEGLTVRDRLKANDDAIAQVLKEMTICQNELMSLQQQLHGLTESNKILRNENAVAR